MFTTNVKQYGMLLRRGYEKKVPMFIFGPPGCGKSELPRQVFPQIAKEMKRTFLEWTDLAIEQKLEAINNPEKYWVFCDQRVGQMDSTDLRGIPNMVNSEMLETIPMSWVIYFTKKGAAGSIFFDELNLAAPVVAGQAYQIINERAIADRRLADDVFVFGAGNRAGVDQAFVHEMPFPLKDRFCELEIEPDVESWTEWASGKVNPHLVAFIQWKSSYLYKVDEKKSCKSSTPRGIVRASKMLEGEEVTSNNAHMLISISVGEAFATEFQAYVKCYSQLKWDNIFSKPEAVANMSIDKKWAVIGGLAEHFERLDSKVTTESQNMFNKIMSVVNVLEADFAVVSLRMIKGSEESLAKFRKFIKKYANVDKLVGKFGKFIL
jgi:hypothetical protein